MNASNYSFTTLFEFAIPTKGSYSAVIGSVAFGPYDTLVMTQSASTTIHGNVYKTIQGYVLVKRIIDQFLKAHPESKSRRISNWNQNGRSDLRISTETPISIAIEGSSEVKGTYFHPSVVSDVLSWLCADFAKVHMNAAYETAVVEQNSIRHAQYTAEDFHGGLRETDLEESEEEKQYHFDTYLEAQSAKDELEGQLKEVRDRLEQIRVRKNELSLAARKTKKMKDEQIALITEENGLIEKRKAVEHRLSHVSERASDLKAEQTKKRKSTVYNLIENGSARTIYIGISAQAPTSTKSQAEVRFDQHIDDCLKMIRASDQLHVYMAGRVIENCVQNGIHKSEISRDDVRRVFSTVSVQEISCTAQDLHLEETKCIEAFVVNHPKSQLFNSLKNPSCPAKSKRSSSSRRISDSNADGAVVPAVKPKSQCPHCKLEFTRLNAHLKACKAMH